MEILIITSFKVKVLICGIMVINILGNGIQINSMGKVNSSTLMAEVTKVSIIKINKTVSELSHGLTVENMLVNGKMDWSMVKVNTLTKMVLPRNQSGIRDENDRISITMIKREQSINE